jgi:hypothetical protein
MKLIMDTYLFLKPTVTPLPEKREGAFRVNYNSNNKFFIIGGFNSDG